MNIMMALKFKMFNRVINVINSVSASIYKMPPHCICIQLSFNWNNISPLLQFIFSISLPQIALHGFKHQANSTGFAFGFDGFPVGCMVQHSNSSPATAAEWSINGAPGEPYQDVRERRESSGKGEWSLTMSQSIISKIKINGLINST